jgi:pyrimidine oxygenase
MTDCAMKPVPTSPIKIVSAGQSGRGMAFAAAHADYNFVLGSGVNTPSACRETCAKLVEAAEKTGRDVGAYVLFMVIADETDDLAKAKWTAYQDGADVGALWWMADQGAKDASADAGGTAAKINLPEGAVNFNMGTLVGSYASVASMLDEMEGMPGCKGIMLTFDDFLIGLDQFGERIQPLMMSRAGVPTSARPA